MCTHIIGNRAAQGALVCTCVCQLQCLKGWGVPGVFLLFFFLKDLRYTLSLTHSRAHTQMQMYVSEKSSCGSGLETKNLGQTLGPLTKATNINSSLWGKVQASSSFLMPVGSSGKYFGLERGKETSRMSLDEVWEEPEETPNP